MNVAFRVDASPLIGTGHLVRCLTLGHVFRSQGSRTRFVCRNLPPGVGKMVTGAGHELVALDSVVNATHTAGDLQHSHWLPVTQAQDAADAAAVLSDERWDWLIVDHYALDARWEKQLRAHAQRILAIDDLADRDHDCDALLDQNLNAAMHDRYRGRIPEGCLAMFGPRYALLRGEFAAHHEQVSPRTGAVSRLLIFFGGIDASNLTSAALKALEEIETSDFEVDVVIGSQHPYRDQVLAICNQRHFQCHVQTNQMAELMARADLAIGAGGSATWERCCVGLPSLTFAVAENQRSLVATAAAHGLVHAPAIDPNDVTHLALHIAAFIESPWLRESISTAGMEAVDGRGTQRVAERLGASRLVLRQATPNDSADLLRWRNHPTIRSVSRSQTMVTGDEHRQWLSVVMADPQRKLLIGEVAAVPVGVVRFDIEGPSAEVSIYLVPDQQRQVAGRDLLGSAEQWLIQNCPHVHSVRANVIAENVPSHRLFAACGYSRESTWYRKSVKAC